jgi:putative sigma-54 modulation protein
MEVEYTARQVRISKALRTQAEEGMEPIARILGKSVRASIVFGAQKLDRIVELTLRARQQTIVATGKADTLKAALHAAIEHAENQARRHRDRRLESKRLPKEEKVLAAPPVTRDKTRAPEPEDGPGNGGGKFASAALAVHSFPTQKAVVESHIVRSGESISLTPMTIEEAVKDAEFRDRDLLIFHNLSGDLFVLHRRRDGHMELVELP